MLEEQKEVSKWSTVYFIKMKKSKTQVKFSVTILLKVQFGINLDEYGTGWVAILLSQLQYKNSNIYQSSLTLRKH